MAIPALSASSALPPNAEKKLFQIFAKSLSDDYIVFHGAWWQHIKYVVQDREADFIIYLVKGILIVEAKGGKISYEPVNMAWYTNDSKMKKSPFIQAKEIKNKFLDFLGKYTEFINRDFCIGHCVIFSE